MSYKIIYLILFLYCFVSLNAQPAKWKSKKYFTVASYNVENLFDTINDPRINDNEFTPNSDKGYDTKKYFKKLNMLAEVISSIHPEELPELVGLAEIENRTVLKDLVATQKLLPGNYQIVHEDGPDPRGIDLALIYRPEVFKYVSHNTIEVRFPFANNHRTRDILYIKGLVKKDTLHIFVNHWSSRRGGQDDSEIKRLECAKVLKTNVDSIMAQNANAKIIILGDFNDNPNDKSIFEVLDAKKPSDSKALSNLMYELYEKGQGSYYYDQKYDMIDNLIVSKPIIVAQRGFRIYEPKGWVYNPEFICFTNKNGDKSPNKTYGGKKYFGGYSDHFPIYTIFYEK